MAPTFVAAGTVASGTTTCTPAFPAGIAAFDILLNVAESVGGQNITLPSGWAHVSSNGTPVSPVPQSTNTQLTVIWRRYDGTGTAPALAGTVDHVVGRMIAIRGCPRAGNPWNAVTTTTEAVSDTSAVYPSVTTTVGDTLVLCIMATSADPVTAGSTAEVGAMTHAGLTSITERVDDSTNTGNGGVISVISGIRASAGATGASSAVTLATTGFKAFMTLAMQNANVGPQRPYVPTKRTAVMRASNW